MRGKNYSASNKVVFVVLIVLYFMAEIGTRSMADSGTVFTFLGRPIPGSAITGVFASISNICLICLVVFYNKIGLFASLIILLGRFVSISMGLIMGGSVQGISGMFTSMVTLLAVILIYQRAVRIERYQQSLTEQNYVDNMTGIPNMLASSKRVDELIEQGDKFALVSININNFKNINDATGHEMGNKVLKEIAQRWKSTADLKETGTRVYVSRQNGDEFALVIWDYETDDDLENTIIFYQSILENKIMVDGLDFYVTASFGYAQYPQDADNAENLFMYADAAMYEVKMANSSDRILKFTKEILKEEHTLEVEKKIRVALEKDNLYFQLQPQFDMNHKLRGFETLARMKDEEGNVVSPGEFIPVAEKVGLIDRVDGCVFQKSAEFFSDMLKKTHADITLSVNISVRHLMKSSFFKEVTKILETTGLPPKNLEIEITESIMLDSDDKAAECIRKIRDMGIQIAIDDFGTGYSSLSYLYKFPANLLKVDKAFIDKMNTGESSRQYVQAIISIGHIMNFEVISEGVEEPEQLETLKEIGCDYIQGFIWGRPLPPEEAMKVVEESMAL